MTDWKRAAYAGEIARLRSAQLEDPDRCETEADRVDLNRWASMLVNATERYGEHALDVAKAKEAASAHVLMRMRTDAEQRPDEDPAERAVKAHEAGLRLFLAYLAGEVPAERTEPARGARIDTLTPDGAVLCVDLLCAVCAEKCREGRSLRWPKSWEHAAETVLSNGTRIRVHELREPITRCTACQPVEID